MIPTECLQSHSFHNDQIESSFLLPCYLLPGDHFLPHSPTLYLHHQIPDLFLLIFSVYSTLFLSILGWAERDAPPLTVPQPHLGFPSPPSSLSGLSGEKAGDYLSVSACLAQLSCLGWLNSFTFLYTRDKASAAGANPDPFYPVTLEPYRHALYSIETDCLKLEGHGKESIPLKHPSVVVL